MLVTKSQLTADPLFKAIAACAADTRAHKIDLLVGVYKDEFGQTPLMKAVRLAEERVAHDQVTKNYLALVGREAFTSAILDLVVGVGALRRRALGLQSVGGTGALKLLFDLAKRINPESNIWLSNPGYSGHSAIAFGSGLSIKYYRYIENRRGGINEDEMLAALGAAKRGDFVVVDASCHNPTGMDLSTDGWSALGKLCAQMGLTPIVDVAYQGFGTGLESDVSVIATLSEFVDYMMVSVSCSKTFGIYRERAGAAILIGPTQEKVANAMHSLVEIGFSAYAVPPDHGAAIVEKILNDDALRSLWQAELAAMRERLTHLRARLSFAISDAVNGSEIEYIKCGRGMFSLLPLSSSQMRDLRDNFAIHGLENGRINVTCVDALQVETIGQAIRAVSRG